MVSKTKNNYYIFVICLLLGFLFRIATINQSFWVDEFLTLKLVRKSFLYVNKFQLFYFIEHFVILLSEKEWIVRLPSLVFGLFSLILTYYCVRKELDPVTANCTIILLTINSIHICYSQDARPYSLFYLFSTATYFALANAFRVRTIYSWLLFLLMFLLSFNAHLFAVAMLGGNIISILIYLVFLSVRGKIQWNYFLKHFKPILIVYFGIILTIVILFIMFSMELTLVKQSYTTTLKMLDRGMLLYVWKKFSNETVFGSYVYLFFTVIGLIFMFKGNINFAIIVLGQIIGTIGLFFISVHHGIYDRYYLYLLPLYLISVAYGVKSTAFFMARPFIKFKPYNLMKYVLLVFMIGFIIIQSIYGLRIALLSLNENFRDATKIIKVIGNSNQPILYYPRYYSDGINHYLKQNNELIFLDDIENKEHLLKIIERSPVVWAIGVISRKKYDTLLEETYFKKVFSTRTVGNDIELWVKYPTDDIEIEKRFEIALGEAVVQFMPSTEDFVNLGFIYEKYGMIEAQKVMFQKAREFSKKFINNYYVYRGLTANALKKANMYEELVDFYKNIRYIKNENYYGDLADYYLKLKNFQQAEFAYKKMIKKLGKRTPENVHLLYIDTLIAQKKWSEAEKYCVDLIKKGNEFERIFLKLAQIYQEQNNLFKAVNTLNEGLRKYPNSSSITTALNILQKN